jgi:uncharacterized protein (DUF2147 family)
MRLVVSLAGMVFWAALSPAFSASANGEWLVSDKSARILIRACEGRLRGVVVWEREHGLDDQNPDPIKRNRPTLGMQILIGMKATGPDSWAGRIYNAENGKTYNAKVSLLSSNALRVEGCVLGLLCAGETWTKVKEHTGDCAPTTSAHSPTASPNQ